jgi:two-component system, cell cycle sensor histidine kinase and response regulator CckA
MSGAGEQGLVAQVGAALEGEDPEACWAAALGVLAAAGIRAAEEGCAARAWLQIEWGERRFAFAHVSNPPDPQTREALHALLRLGLARSQDQERLRRVQERLEMLSSASFEGLFVHEGGSIIDSNTRMSELLGYTPEEVLGTHTMGRCIAPEDLPRVRQRMAEQFEGAYVISGVRKDGSRFRAELQTKQGKLGQRPVRVVAVRDVTERERTHALLHESEARLRELARKTFDLIAYSRDGVVLETEGQSERLLGIPGSSMVGRKLVDFVAPAEVPSVTQLLAAQRTGTYETSLINSAGEYVPVEITAVMTTLGGEPVRMGGVRDLREARRLDQERRRLQDQLQRSQRLESLGVLAGGVAHDFNNLLVGVLGNAELLQDSLRDLEDRKLCEAIIGAAQRAADLTGQLLAYAGRRDLGARQSVDLSTLWKELCGLLGARISKQARLELQLSPSSLVLGDRAGLTQMFMNLLTNASDALEDDPGLIEVTTRRVREPDARWDHALGAPVGPGDWILTEVRDTGVGMDQATLLRVFEPFFSTKERGHGLGLASCLGIVAAHGGALAVESEPGAGSRFSVLLPAVPHTASLAPSVRAASAEPARRLLVIDDESVVRSFLRRSLERRGYHVTDASGGNAGLRALADSVPDLIILDMTMPELDGVEVVRRVREQDLDVPILLTSGNVDPALERRLDAGSFQGFLRKPFSIAELMTAIEGLLGNGMPGKE